MRRKEQSRGLRHSRDLLRDGDATGERAVRLIDVQAAFVEVDLELVESCVQLAAGDADRGVRAEVREAIVVVGVERLFDPEPVVSLELSERRCGGLAAPAADVWSAG